MEYKFDRKILLSTESEYESLYNWSLQEYVENGKGSVGNFIPWSWSLYFSASELRYSKTIEQPSHLRKKQESKGSEVKPFLQKDTITATLHSGRNFLGGLKNAVSYSMFGTGRIIKLFELIILRIESPDFKERCTIDGCVEFTAEVDFRNITNNDSVSIYLEVSAARFDSLRSLIQDDAISTFDIRIGGVDGFYNEWSPSITPDFIKVLALGAEQEITVPEGCEIVPPRLGFVSEFSLYITTLRKLPIQTNDTNDDHAVITSEKSKEDANEIISKRSKGDPADAIKYLQVIKRLLWIIILLLAAIIFKHS